MVSAGYNEDAEAETAKGKEPGDGREGGRANQRCQVQRRKTDSVSSSMGTKADSCSDSLDDCAESCRDNETKPISVPTVTYLSWADEVEAADLEAEDKPAGDESDALGSAMDESDIESANEDPTDDSAVDESENPVDEELLDYESTLTRVSMDINMVYYLPTEFRAVEEEAEVAQINFGPKNAIFEKPEGPVKHLKPLYI